jgi:hypothetical protein
MKFLGLILILFSMNTLSQANSMGGGMGSGGGSGIVCFRTKEAAEFVRRNGGIVPDGLINQIGALQVLDLQLAFMTNRNLFLAQPGQSVNDYFSILLLRLKQSYPDIYASLELGALQRNVLYRLNPLSRVLDENDVGTEDSDYCTLTNFAVQYSSVRGPVIHIDNRLYSHPQHSTSSKAILLLHESIYSVLRKRGQTNSREVRDIIMDIL